MRQSLGKAKNVIHFTSRNYICINIYVTKSALGGGWRQNPVRIGKIKNHGHLPVINLPPRENLITAQKQHLIVNKRLYRPQLKNYFQIPHQKYVTRNPFYYQNHDHHTEKKSTKDFQSLLSKIQNQHNYKKTSSFVKEMNQVQVSNSQHLNLPVVIDPVIQIDQETSKYALDFKDLIKIVQYIYSFIFSGAHLHQKSSLFPQTLIPWNILSL